MFLTVGAGPQKAKQRLYLMHIQMPSGLMLVKIGNLQGLPQRSV